MPRKEFTKKTKIAAWMRSGGRCEFMLDDDGNIAKPGEGKRCNVKIVPPMKPEYHHGVEEYLTHDNSVDNCVVGCPTCHGKYTAKRRPEINKTRRQFEERINVRPKKKFRPLPGTKRSGIRKRMDGTVERWK